ncbi:aminotransferase class III-fold pyridoxal phosphate-dependent enzyme [Bordetella sp. 2513F-2]
MTPTSPLTNDQVRALETELVMQSWSAQGGLKPLAIAGGSGCTLWDYDGNRYLDFSSQLINTNIGHQHPKVVKAIQEQAGTLCTLAPANATAVRVEAARRILARAPRGFAKVFFTNAGADANENAMRMARQYTGRDKILSAYRSYHGNTGGAIVATGDPRRVPNEYARGHVHFFNPYLYRSEFHATDETAECQRALQHLRRVIEAEGPGSIAAILLETIPGTAGVLVPPPGYLSGVRALADEFGILLILDEVMVGFGRTGAWLALDHFDVVPDLIVFAKGVNSGYVPAGGVMVSEKVAEYFRDRVFPGGLTYSGHPLAMASIVATLEAMEEEDMVGNARRIGQEALGPGVRELAGRHPIIGDARGLGVFWALEFVSDPVQRTPLPAARVAQLKAEALRRGLIVFAVENRFHLAPPCPVSAEQVAQGLAILDEVLSEHGRL